MIFRKQLQNSFLSKTQSLLLQHNQILCYVERQPALHRGTSVLVCATVVDCTVTWFRWEWVWSTTHHAVSQSLWNQVKVPCYTGGAVFTTTRNNTLGGEWLRAHAVLWIMRLNSRHLICQTNCKHAPCPSLEKAGTWGGGGGQGWGLNSVKFLWTHQIYAICLFFLMEIKFSRNYR